MARAQTDGLRKQVKPEGNGNPYHHSSESGSASTASPAGDDGSGGSITGRSSSRGTPSSGSPALSPSGRAGTISSAPGLISPVSGFNALRSSMVVPKRAAISSDVSPS